MFLTHEGWKLFLEQLSGMTNVRVTSLEGITKYAHHTLIEVDIAMRP